MKSATTIGSARAISVDPSGLVLVKGINVQQALNELDTYIANLELTGGAGAPGTPGSSGADGLSAYQIWLSEGNVGTEEEFLISLVGPEGPPGADGVDGAAGAPGADGAEGPQGPEGNTTAEVAYVENATGTVTGPLAGVAGAFATGGALVIPNTTLIVPVSTLSVTIDAWLLGQQMAAGTGLAFLEIWETTGAPVLLSRTQGVMLPNQTAADVRRNFGVYHPPLRLGPVPTERSFQLRMNTFGFAAQTPSWQAANTNALGFKTWARALAT